MLDEKVAVYDTRIEEMSHLEHYEENVRKLCCFRSVAAHTALSLLVEAGDFQRFRSAKHFAAYLGLVPGEHSSSDRASFSSALHRCMESDCNTACCIR